MAFQGLSDRLQGGINQIKATTDTVAYVGRMANNIIFKQFKQGACGWCNNFDPRGMAEVSDKSRGLWELPGDDVNKRRQLYGGRVWCEDEAQMKRVLASANMGCEICFMILTALEYLQPGSIDETSRSRISVIDFSLLEGAAPRICARGYNSSRRINLEFFRSSDAPQREFSKLPNLPVLKQRADSSNDAEVWSFIKQCLTNCDNHTACQRPSRGKKLPKRLLQLGADDRALKLIETGEVEEVGGLQYVTLSYCWGGATSLQLLNDNIDDFKTSISWDSLAVVIQNGIAVARQINIKYLWVDTLCIIQNNSQDWEQQAAEMFSIYEGAYLTISAGSSADVNTPFLGARDVTWSAHNGNLKEPDGTDSCVLWRRFPTPSASLKSGPSRAKYLESQSWTGPLYERAWCYQETAISRRILHFTPGPVVFECQTFRIAEDQDLPGDPVTPPNATDVVKHDYTWTETAWNQAVSQYSRRFLTFESDTLHALSGIAAEFADAKSGQYLAGMWKTSLLRDLTWHCLPDVEHDVHESYIAPSWSWAGIRCGIANNTWRVEEYYAEVVSASTTVLGSNPFGAVSDGEVVLRAPLTPVKISWTKKDNQSVETLIREYGDRRSDVTLLLDTMVYDADGILEDGGVEKSFRRALPGEELDVDVSKILDLAYQVYLCPILRAANFPGVCLVLGRSTTVPGAFVRLGVCWRAPEGLHKSMPRVDVRIV